MFDDTLTKGDAQRAAEFLLEAGVKSLFGSSVESLNWLAQYGHGLPAGVLVLAAEVVELREMNERLKGDKARLDGDLGRALARADRAEAEAAAHEDGLVALAATIEKACQEAAEARPDELEASA